jgi:hypothetical protein
LTKLSRQSTPFQRKDKNKKCRRRFPLSRRPMRRYSEEWNHSDLMRLRRLMVRLLRRPKKKSTKRTTLRSAQWMLFSLPRRLLRVTLIWSTRV